MGIYRTAQGRPLDMASLAAKNEKTRAVGNMNVNARGDTIDSHGKVIVPVTRKVGNRYNNSVANPESNRARSTVREKPEASPEVDATPATAPATAPAQVVEEKLVESIFDEMTDDDLEFLEPSNEDLEIEEIKKAELAKTKKK
jgi:hypothetical protein